MLKRLIENSINRQILTYRRGPGHLRNISGIKNLFETFVECREELKEIPSSVSIKTTTKVLVQKQSFLQKMYNFLMRKNETE